MHITEFDFVGLYIRKLYRVFCLIVGSIAAIELVLSARGFLLFDLARLKHRLYLYSYLFLLIASAVTLAVLLFCRKRDARTGLMVVQTYIYSACLIVWATFVTGIDCAANGDSGVIVYIMVCISVGVLTLIKPLFYSIILCVSSAALLGCVWAIRGAPYSGGFYINFAVFVVLAAFINAHNYRLNRREYETNAKLERLSYTDQLTGLYNRRQLDAQVAAYAERGERYLFVMADIDDYKQINDLHGHTVGDACLVMIADHLRTQFGEQVYRFGGDEFIMLCDLDAEEACRRIEQVNHALVSAYAGIDLHLSAGIYRAGEADDVRTVFLRADRALYRAKAEGKRACCIDEPVA